MKRSKYAIGRRWLCPERPGFRGAFYFVIVGPPALYNDKTHKKCRLEYVEERDRQRFGLQEDDFAHSHLRKYGKLIEDEEMVQTKEERR